MSIEKIICYTLFHSTSMALPQHFLITSLPLPRHFLCTSLSLPYHFLVTSLACPLLFFCTSLAHPRHLINTSSHFLGTRRFLGTSCALPSHFLGTSSTLSQCFLCTSLEIPRHKKSRKKYLKKKKLPLWPQKGILGFLYWCLYPHWLREPFNIQDYLNEGKILPYFKLKVSSVYTWHCFNNLEEDLEINYQLFSFNWVFRAMGATPGLIQIYEL